MRNKRCCSEKEGSVLGVIVWHVARNIFILTQPITALCQRCRERLNVLHFKIGLFIFERKGDYLLKKPQKNRHNFRDSVFLRSLQHPQQSAHPPPTSNLMENDCAINKKNKPPPDCFQMTKDTRVTPFTSLTWLSFLIAGVWWWWGCCCCCVCVFSSNTKKQEKLPPTQGLSDN